MNDPSIGEPPPLLAASEYRTLLQDADNQFGEMKFKKFSVVQVCGVAASRLPGLFPTQNVAIRPSGAPSRR